MLAPPSFVLPTPHKNTSKPSPGPPSYLKHQVYDDPHVFEKVDCHAIRVSQNSYPSFKDLLWDLVFRYQLTDLEKARVIFRWMTACDMNFLKFTSVSPGNPEEVLLSLKNLKGSYANAFELMCSYAGLCCLTISGYAKGVDYRPGDLFKQGGFNHTWNVIHLQGSWQLIDAHWATRYLTSGKNTQDSIVYQYDDFYFIMEPQQAVYSHFPETASWQLLEKPLQLNQFENLPLTKSQFFKCGMDFRSQHHGVVHSKDGYLKMNLGFWKPDSFTYKLQTDDNKDQFEGVSLRYYVLQETVNNQINFFFRFPTTGVFYLTIFAQELNEHNQPISQENTFRAACEYKIIADKAAANCCPYPMTCHDSNWGPSWSLISHYQLTPQQEDGVISINSPTGKPFVQKEIVFDKLRDDVSLLCKLRKNGVTDEDVLDQYIEITEKSDKTSFFINLPEPGEYGLEIYANEPSEGDTYTHICQYLLDFEPPPGYKHQTSVFGSGKDHKPLSYKPSKIRDMYNYEKDAAPIGTLPKPYMPTQYTVEDITMIPGQTKAKPMPFAYQKNEGSHTKTEDSDLEMPDFLPPPPPLNGQNIKPQHEINLNTSAPLPPPIDLSNDPYSENKVSKFNPTNQHPTEFGRTPYQSSNQQMNSGGKFPGNQYPTEFGRNPYQSSNQQMNSGEKFPGNQHPTEFGRNPYQSSNQQINPGEKFPGNQKNINYSIQTAAPFSKSPAGAGKSENPGNEKSYNYKTESVDSDSAKLQPYMANVEKGHSPQLSRKVYPNSPTINLQSQDNNAKDLFGPSIASKGGKYPMTTNSEKTSELPKYSSQDKNDRITLSELNMVASAFGKSDGITSQQPYLQNIMSGGSPSLSRKPMTQKSTDSNQDKSALISAKNDSYASHDQSNNDSKKNPAFRGYGRPNFKTSGSTETTPGSIYNQNQQPNQDHITPDHHQNQMYSSDISLNLGTGKTPSQNAQQSSGNITKPGLNVHQNQNAPRSSSTSPIHPTSLNPYQTGYSTSKPGYGANQQSGFTPNTKGTNKYSTFKESESNISFPGNKYSSFAGNNIKDLSDNREDPRKISNIAVTLSPSGFKNPNKIDLLSDQYNKQYEDSSKIVSSPLQKYRPDESTANWTSGPMQKEPPKNFEPKPIAVEEEIYKPEIQALPSAMPVTTAISPEETSKIFQKVDEHAMQVSAQQQDSFNQLIWQLIYARNITDELEKVRVIFLWLCTKDLHKMNFDNTKQDSPEEILMGIRTGKSTYAQIFSTLCRYAGLHCKLIIGYAKGADYVPGMKFQGRQGEHSWNAVLIEGVWRLIDCHWAARRLIGKEHTPENVRYELDMFYFLANPSQLIYTHFPHDTDWQLLHHPINIDEFECLAPVKSMFFKYNLDLVTHKNAVIQSNAPEFELKIAFPSGIEERLLFTFTLSFDDGKEEYNGVPLLRYGRQEIDFDNSHSCFWIRTPIPGSYKLLIYAKLVNNETNTSENDSQKMFGAICEYKIDASFPAKQALGQFPPCQSSTYGPNEMYKQYPIECKNPKSSFYISNGTVEIKFLIKNIRIMAKLFNCNVKNSEQMSEQCILQRLVGTDEAVINVFLPEPGEYGLEVYANEPKKNGNSFYAVWQYFIVSTSASIVSGLPSLQPGYLGPYEPKFSEYGMSTYSHKDPFIVANTGDLCIQIRTSRDKPVRIMAQLIHCSHNVNEMCSDQVLQLGRESVIYFLIRLPHKGFFKFQIFALPYSEMSESLPGVFNYLIESNQKSQSGLAFPQQFAQWKEGSYLYEPMDGVLGTNGKPDRVAFRMDVMRAKSVAVIVDNEWTKLDKNPDGTWFGEVDMRAVWKSSVPSDLTVCANYDTIADESYTTILRYTIQK